MKAETILAMLLGVRPAGSDRWKARCPAHEDKRPSLAIKQTQDRTLIKCFAGCTAADICSALGLTLADLFLNSCRPHLPALHQCRAADVLELWRQRELIRCAEDLRARDTVIRHIDRAVTDGLCTADAAMILLAYEYDGYTQLEDRFTRLLRDEDTLAMWREWRRSA